MYNMIFRLLRALPGIVLIPCGQPMIIIIIVIIIIIIRASIFQASFFAYVNSSSGVNISEILYFVRYDFDYHYYHHYYYYYYYY